MLSRRLFCGCVVSGGVAAALVPTPASAEDELEEENYPLDAISRRVPRRGPLKCPDVEIVTHRGKHLRYAAAAKVYSGFVARLELMEREMVAHATATYGRPPRRLVHLGTYNCRRMRKYPDWISEHGLGNAIDVAGFDFGALEKGKQLPSGVPRVFRHAFAVRVLRHWKAERGPAKLHRTFLRTLARRLIERKDIFRVILGPSYPGHWNHFHFDCAPFRMVDVFESD